MHFFCLLFLLCGLFLETNTIFASKKHRFKPFKTKQQRTQETNQQLERAAQIVGNDNWFKRQAIIRHAVMHRVNPDELRSLPGDKTTPLFECVMEHYDENGLQFAAFLLNRGANARALHRCRSEQRPLISFAKTVPMVRLLWAHGAQKQITDVLLENAIESEDCELALIPFCIAHGANPNGLANKRSTMLESIMPVAEIDRKNFHEKALLLLRAGASLTLKHEGRTFPQKMKDKIAQYQQESSEAKNRDELSYFQLVNGSRVRLESLRSKVQEEYDTMIVEQNRKLCTPLLHMLHPDLPAVTASYGGGPMRYYEELEALPVNDEIYHEEKIRLEHLNNAQVPVIKN